MTYKPECKTCGLLKSTVDGLAPFGPACVKDGKHEFPDELGFVNADLKPAQIKKVDKIWINKAIHISKCCKKGATWRDGNEKGICLECLKECELEAVIDNEEHI